LSQQPFGHAHCGWTEVQAFATHVLLLVAQTAHVPPPVPHAQSESPGWHCLTTSTHPLQVPPSQTCVFGLQAAPFVPQSWHGAPPRPHIATSVPGWQVELWSKHPLHGPATQAPAVQTRAVAVQFWQGRPL